MLDMYFIQFQTATTTAWDLPGILFGGKYKLQTRTTVELRNAFHKDLHPVDYSKQKKNVVMFLQPKLY